jgi:hypothetical protein
MRPPKRGYGWTHVLVGIMLLVCVFCATTATISHLHPATQESDDGHCSLCTLGATLVAVVVVLSLHLSWFRVISTSEYDCAITDFVQVRVPSIRPPPVVSFPY